MGENNKFVPKAVETCEHWYGVTSEIGASVGQRTDSGHSLNGSIHTGVEVKGSPSCGKDICYRRMQYDCSVSITSKQGTDGGKEIGKLR